jgi:uncharacterized membrane protein YidH (DUF202 family)
MAGRAAGDPASPGTDDLEPRADAIERYWQTIQAQMSFLERIDVKAQRLVRYTALLVGIVLTAVSFVSRTGGVVSTDVSLISRLSFVLGIGMLLAAIGLVAYTSLNSAMRYGLGQNFGHCVADGTIRSPDYERIVMNAYASVVGQNRKVVNVNGRRFQRSLIALLVGLVYVSSSGLMVVLSVGPPSKVLLLMVVSAIATWIARHIHEEQYLVLERKHYDND